MQQRVASRVLAKSNESDKNLLLEKIALQLEKNTDAILAANALDAKDAALWWSAASCRRRFISDSCLLRKSSQGMIAAVRAVADLPDPAGRVLARTLWTRT